MQLTAYFIEALPNTPGIAAPVAKVADLFRVHSGTNLKVTGPSGDLRNSKYSATLRCQVFQIQEDDILDYSGIRYEVSYVDDGGPNKFFNCNRI